MPHAEADPSRDVIPPDNSLSVPETHAGGQSPSIRVWALSLAAGLIAGIVSWLIGEALHGQLRPSLLATSGFPSGEEAHAHALGVKSAVTLEASFAFGLLGSALGLALGAAGGTVRRSARAGLTASAFGAVLGAAVGAALPWLLLPIYFRIYNPDRGDLGLAILIQGGLGSVIGAVGGAAYGLGLGGRGRAARALAGGLLGALAGVLLYEIVGALAFPLDETTKPLSASSVTRLLARLTVAVLASIGATRGAWSAPRIRPDRHPAA